MTGGGFSPNLQPVNPDPFSRGLTGGRAVCPIGQRVQLRNINLSPKQFPIWQIMVYGVDLPAGTTPADSHASAAKVLLRVGSGFSSPIDIVADVGPGTVITVPAGEVSVFVDCSIEAVAGNADTRGSGDFSCTIVPGQAMGVGAYYSRAIPPIPPLTIGQLVEIPPLASDCMFRWNPPTTGFPAGATPPYLFAMPGESPAVLQLDAAYIYGASSTANPRDLPQPWQPIPARSRFVQVFNLSGAVPDTLAGVVIFKLRV